MAHLILLALPQRAGAIDRVQECIREHVDAQRLRKRGLLLAARARLLECASPSCPALVRDECAALSREVAAVTPSVVLSALDARGRPTAEPVVSIDGSPELVPLDGRALAFDPGEHRLRFHHPDGGTREVRLVLEESEHGRRVVADFRSKGGSESTLGRRRWTSVMSVSAGVAAVALGSFTYFALSGRAVENSLSRCKPNCENGADLDRMRSHYLIADASLGVALVSAGVGVYAWMQRSSASSSGRSQSATRSRVSLLPALTWGRAELWASGEF